MVSEQKNNDVFAKDVLFGLSQNPKRLYSKYFYDEQGDKIFQEIMNMKEYYLTKSEFEIFSMQKKQIFDASTILDSDFQLIEFGAGDGFKTKVLLEYLIKTGASFEYIPIDISNSVLQELSNGLKEKYPKLKVRPIENTYFEALEGLSSDKRKLILFLGSNIGNFTQKEALDFLAKTYKNLNDGDQILIGVDLKKDPEIILEAYNDKKGITKSFNLNLLARINRELGANFDLTQFKHFPSYDPISGETKSYLISMKDQKVSIESLNTEISFSYGEPIFMEISKKYGLDELEVLARQSNFTLVEHFFDCKHYYVNSLWKK